MYAGRALIADTLTKPFRATVIDGATGEREDVSGEFTSDEWQAVQRFAEFEEELSRTDYVSGRMPLEGRVSWNRETGWERPALPAPSTVREFLLMLRPFVLDDEPTSFYRVLNIISRRYVSAALRANLGLLRDAYNGRHLRDLLVVSIDDLVVNSDAGLKAWLNAFEYHRDEDKRAIFRNAHENIPLDVLKVFFIDLLREKVQAIEWLAMFIRYSARSPEAPHTITLAATYK